MSAPGAALYRSHLAGIGWVQRVHGRRACLPHVVVPRLDERKGARETRVIQARRLTTILPAMTLAEAIETTRIHSVAGMTGDRTALVTTRPFCAPHHTISDAGLIGGVAPTARGWRGDDCAGLRVGNVTHGFCDGQSGS